MRRTVARGLGLRAVVLVLTGLLLVSVAAEGLAQRRQRGAPVPVPIPERPLPEAKAPEQDPAPAAKDEPRETVQADVSTRRIAVTANFSGTEVVVFGAVDNSRQTSAEAGLYDVVIVLVGTPSRLVVRRKANVAGLWLNVQSLVFDSVPSYYAIASTRPLDEIASEDVLKAYDIGFEHVRMTLSSGTFTGPPTKEIKEFRDAVVRIKQRENLFQEEQYGVAFIGRSLFRASIDLPATVTVGPFDTRVFLFRDGELLSQYTVRLNLEREGLEELLHAFALRHSLFYGLATVLLAVAAGLIASAVFRRNAH